MNINPAMRYKLLCLILSLPLSGMVMAQSPANNDAARKERAYLIKSLVRIADPVLTALSKNELKQLMPMEAKTGDRKNYTYLEAFGRLLAGMAPWLELGPDQTPEGVLRKKYIELARTGLHNATDPNSPDFMNFNKFWVYLSK